MQQNIYVNREYKDRLFRFIFKEKKALLELYNALNDKNYTNPDELEIYTMDEFIYMGMKNDVSFMLDWTMNIFEHQSTFNPNMTIRGLSYTTSMFEKYISMNRLNIYGSRKIMLPVPKYYVFYNGTTPMEDEVVLYLTDNMPENEVRSESCVEFKAHFININKGHSPKMMERCPLLRQYAVFIADVRENLANGMELKEAVNDAVTRCIEKNEELSKIIRGHKAEVTRMLLTEYDEAFHIASEKEISLSEGIEIGERRGIEIGKAEERKRSDIFKLKLKGNDEAAIAKQLKLPIEQVLKVLEEV